MRVYRLLSLAIVSAVLISGGFTYAHTQTSGTGGIFTGLTANADNAAPTPGAGHDYIHLLSETVNPANGSVDIKISYGAPPSRGITLPAVWTYNSGHVFSLMQDPTSTKVEFEQPYFTVGQYDLFPVATWSESSYQPPPIVQGTGNSPITQPACNYATSFTFRGPDGVSHNVPLGVVATTTNDPYSGNGGCTGASATATATDGVVTGAFVSTTATLADVGAWVINSSGRPTSNLSVGAFTITDIDGTTYFFDGTGGAQQATGIFEEYAYAIEDRNGNIVAAGCGMYCDTAGRSIETSSSTIEGTVATTVVEVGGVSYTTSNASPGSNESPGNATINYTVPAVQVIPVPGSNNPDDVGCTQLYPVWSVPAPDAALAAPVQRELTITLPTTPSSSYTLYFGDYNPTDSDPNATNHYGLINEIVYPDGGWVKYSWAIPSSPNYTQAAAFPGVYGLNAAYPGTLAMAGCVYEYATPVVSTRQVSYDGVNPAQTQSFSYSTTWDTGNDGGVWSTKTTAVTTTDNITGKTALTQYTYQPSYLSPGTSPSGSVASEVPVEQTISRYDWGNTTVPLDVETKGWFTNTPMVSQLACDFHTLNNGALTTGHFYEYVYPAQISDDKEYDFGQITNPSSVCSGSNPTAPSNVVPVRETAKTFTTFTSPQGIAFAKPYTVIVSGNGTQIAETEYLYDKASIATSLSKAPPLPSGTHDETNFPVSIATNRGNVTTATRLCAGCTNATTTYTYDETGQLASMTDPCGNNTTCSDMNGTGHKTVYSFVDSPPGANSYGNSNAYLTQVIDPLSHTHNYQYNYVSGQLTQAQDENTQITAYDYSDPLFRLTDIYDPASIQNGGTKPHTQYSYIDGAGASMTTTSATGVVSKKLFDGLGHTIQTQLLSDPGGIDYADTVFDGVGQVYSTSNPYRSKSDSTYGVTTYSYDGIGRKLLQVQPDNVTSVSTTNGVTTTTNSSVQQWSYNDIVVSNVITFVTGFVDENGNQWARTSDGLGRLTNVVEPGGLQTSYTYDALNNLLSVNQSGASGDEYHRYRSFTYDSLSRLLSANNPETGLVCYGLSSAAGCNSTANGYDANGNLSAKTDARGVTTTYTYDEVNRLLSESSSGAISSCFQYDGSEANGIGRLAKEWTNSSCASTGYITLRSILAYDEMGRIASEQQCTPGNCMASTGPQLWYGYDLSGDNTCLADSAAPPSLNGVALQTSPSCLNGAVGTPSGLLLTTSFDLGSHMSGVTSNASAYAKSIYSLRTSPTYGFGPTGPLYWSLGSGLSLNENYTNRLRVNSFAATSAAP